MQRQARKDEKAERKRARKEAETGEDGSEAQRAPADEGSHTGGSSEA